MFQVGFIRYLICYNKVLCNMEFDKHYFKQHLQTKKDILANWQTIISSYFISYFISRPFIAILRHFVLILTELYRFMVIFKSLLMLHIGYYLLTHLIFYILSFLYCILKIFVCIYLSNYMISSGFTWFFRNSYYPTSSNVPLYYYGSLHV